MPRANSPRSPVIVWFRQDLRLADHPALTAAAKSGAPVIPLYIRDDASPGDWPMGAASRWWLHHSLTSLAKDLARCGGRLILRQGEAGAEIERIMAETGAKTVLWTRLYEPWAIARDIAIKARLTAARFQVESFNGTLLFEPWEIASKTKEPYRVFTPFWRAGLAAPPPSHPQPTIGKLAAPSHWPASDDLDSWQLTPSAPDWATGLGRCWTPGQAGALARLDEFLRGGLADYGELRDRPDRDGTSRLSPHLHFGELGPRQVWHRVQAAIAAGEIPGRAGEAFLRQLGWREFSYSLLYHNPTLPEQPLQPAFREFPWRDDGAALRAWQRGETGYPIVDAGMRQLWRTGWMHNRMRMVVGSFLVKHLLLPWQAGEAWFWDTLVDADLANNAASWQWIAGCGADAAPYYRVFNPMLQGAKFDPDGAYVRRWVPELARLPAAAIHQPWTADVATLAAAKVVLGRTYPRPIIDHKVGRERALVVWRRFRKA